MDKRDIFEALMSSRPSEYFERMKDTEELRSDFPELAALIGSEQNKHYHLEDVWTHTMMCVDLAAGVRGRSTDEKSFMLGTLLHDIGKPEVQSISYNAQGEKVIHSKGHPRAGAAIAAKVMDRFGIDEDIREYVVPFVRYHDFMNYIDEEKISDEQAFKVMDSIESYGLLDDVLLFHTEVDSKGVVRGNAGSEKLAKRRAWDRVHRYYQRKGEVR